MSTKTKTHKLTVTAMLGAVAVVLMLMEFSIPFLIPDFVKMDLSELPALLAAFSLGPVYGIAVCFIKNWLPNGRYALNMVAVSMPAAAIASKSFVIPSFVTWPFIQCHHVPTPLPDAAAAATHSSDTAKNTIVFLCFMVNLFFTYSLTAKPTMRRLRSYRAKAYQQSLPPSDSRPNIITYFFVERVKGQGPREKVRSKR